MNARQYFEQMCKEAGLDENSTAALLTAVSNEKVSGRMDSLVKTATEDYNAQIGRVRAADEKLQKYDSWYGTASAQHAAALAELTETKTKLAALAGVTSGNGNGNDGGSGDPKYLTASDLAAFAKEQGTRLAAVVKETARLSSRHASKWGEEIDVDAIDKIAQEQNISLTGAYDKWIEPRLKEKEAQGRVDWEKTRTAEIERDLRSRFQLPVDTAPPAPAPVFATRTAPADANTLTSELVSAWNSSAVKP